MSMRIQLQRREERLGCSKGRRTGRSIPTTPSRRPSCRRSATSLVVRWPNRDPIGELGGKNLYVIGFNHPIYGVDPLGLDWLQDSANFAAGVGDSLTFGLTYQARKGINWMLFGEFDSGVDPESGAYIAGEWTETVVEITVTAGGASLRHVAKHSTRRALEME